MRRAVMVLLVALAGMGAAPGPAASAAGIVVVPGTSFPAGSSAYLTWFGCEGLFGPAATGPSSSVTSGAAAPMGTRATRFVMPATGRATGPVTRVDRIARAPWSIWVQPVEGGQGVAHVWYVSARLDEGEVWYGRADLTATAGEWQQVRPADASFIWTRTLAATGEVLEAAGTATVGGFTRAHGDGPGYLLAGFGCDGSTFLLDAITAGDTTYDLEGFPVSTTIEASHARVVPGSEVTVTGRTLDGAQRATGAPLVLEARPEGAAEFTPVRPEPVPGGVDGTVATTVTPAGTTDYRWYQPATGYADAGWSPVITVRVGR